MATRKKSNDPLDGIPLALADSLMYGLDASGASGLANNPVGTTVDELRNKNREYCALHGHKITPKTSYSITHGTIHGWGCDNCRQRWRCLSLVQRTRGRFIKRTQNELVLADPFIAIS